MFGPFERAHFLSFEAQGSRRRLDQMAFGETQCAAMWLTGHTPARF